MRNNFDVVNERPTRHSLDDLYLGLAYSSGIGPQHEDPVQAFTHLRNAFSRRSDARENASAALHLGVLLVKNASVIVSHFKQCDDGSIDEDDLSPVTWFVRAVENEPDPYALFFLAQLFQSGSETFNILPTPCFAFVCYKSLLSINSSLDDSMMDIAIQYVAMAYSSGEACSSSLDELLPDFLSASPHKCKLLPPSLTDARDTLSKNLEKFGYYHFFLSLSLSASSVDELLSNYDVEAFPEPAICEIVRLYLFGQNWLPAPSFLALDPILVQADLDYDKALTYAGLVSQAMAEQVQECIGK